MNLWGGQQNITKATFPARIENSMINLYNVAKKVIVINPFNTPYKNVPYTALFYHTMTLKVARQALCTLWWQKFANSLNGLLN